MNCACRSSHDITFCTGLRCDKKEKCHRLITKHTFEPNERISIAEFSDHNGSCDHFWPEDDNE